MYQYHCLNAISSVGLEVFDENYTKVDDMKDADAVLVRSAAMHDMDFDKNIYFAFFIWSPIVNCALKIVF